MPLVVYLATLSPVLAVRPSVARTAIPRSRIFSSQKFDMRLLRRKTKPFSVLLPSAGGMGFDCWGDLSAGGPRTR